MPKLNCLIISLVVCLISISAKVYSQISINEKFDQLFLGENFDSCNTFWSTVSNSDNLLIVQEGEYIMHRKSTVSPFAVMGNFSNDLTAFKLVTSIKLDKTSAVDGSIGLIFMAQADGKGGFIFEINRNSYRLRQIDGGNYKYICGNSKTGGWVESSYVKGLNLPNLIEIRTYNHSYDLLINNNYILSFTESGYNAGSFGFIIGPASKGKADFMYLFTTSKAVKTESSYDSNNSVSGQNTTLPETDVMALAESIILLKTQMNKLSEENDDLKQIIQAMRGGENENEKQKENYNKQLKEYEAKIKMSATSYDSLVKVNTDLLRYKEMVMGNDNGDLVINLSKNLKKEKILNDELLKSNKALTDSLLQLKNELKNSKTKNTESTVNNQKAKSASENDAEKKPEKKEFVLPKEN